MSELLRNKQITSRHNFIKIIHLATCFDPMGSPSGWFLKRTKESMHVALWK